MVSAARGHGVQVGPGALVPPSVARKAAEIRASGAAPGAPRRPRTARTSASLRLCERAWLAQHREGGIHADAVALGEHPLGLLHDHPAVRARAAAAGRAGSSGMTAAAGGCRSRRRRRAPAPAAGRRAGRRSGGVEQVEAADRLSPQAQRHGCDRPEPGGSRRRDERAASDPGRGQVVAGHDRRGGHAVQARTLVVLQLEDLQQTGSPRSRRPPPRGCRAGRRAAARRPSPRAGRRSWRPAGRAGRRRRSRRRGCPPGRRTSRRAPPPGCCPCPARRPVPSPGHQSSAPDARSLHDVGGDLAERAAGGEGPRAERQHGLVDRDAELYLDHPRRLVDLHLPDRVVVVVGGLVEPVRRDVQQAHRGRVRGHQGRRELGRGGQDPGCSR